MGESYVGTTYIADGISKPIAVNDANKAFVLETVYGVAQFFDNDIRPIEQRIVAGCVGRNDGLGSVAIAEALDVARNMVDLARKNSSETGKREDEFSILCDATRWFLGWAWDKPSKAAG